MRASLQEDRRETSISLEGINQRSLSFPILPRSLPPPGHEKITWPHSPLVVNTSIEGGYEFKKSTPANWPGGEKARF